MEYSEELEALARSIQAGDCVLVLGSGACPDCATTPEIPIDQKLARYLAASLPGIQREDLDIDDLRHVSQLWHEATKNSARLQVEVMRFYKQFAGRTTDFHRNIAALPFRLCVTTTPDDFLFNAFTSAGKQPARNFYNFRKPRTSVLLEPSTERPLIFHLYGYQSDPSSLVITENDLIDFLAAVVRNAPPLPETIRATFRRPDLICLFVDLGFKNWYLRVLMRSLGLHGHTEMSMAIEPPEFFAQSKLHQSMVYFSASTTIEFHRESLNEFAAALKAAYDSVAGSSQSPIAEPPPGAPLVFLSYADEDRSFVERLAANLKNAGVAVWQDKQNLRAGDNWARVLKQVIDKQADYVVAVQTPAMALPIKGYFNEELREALEQSRQIRTGFRFILPVHINEADRLPMLADLHSIPVGSDGDVSQLVAAIFDDWRLRPRKMEAAGAASVGT